MRRFILSSNLHKSQSIIYVYHPSVNSGTDIKMKLSSNGYDSFYFSDIKTLKNRISENPPLILLFDTMSVVEEINELINWIRSVASSVLFIPITDFENFDTFSQYKDFGFIDIVLNNEDYLSERCLWSMNLVFEKLSLKHALLNLENQLFNAKNENLQIESKIIKLENELNFNKNKAYQLQINDYQTSVSSEEMLEKFLKIYSGKKIIYLKYLKDINSFIPMVKDLESQIIKAIDLEKSDVDKLSVNLMLGKIPEPLIHYTKAYLNFSIPSVLPIYILEKLEGVFIYCGSQFEEFQGQLFEAFSIFKICFLNFHYEKRIDHLEVSDNVSGLFNLKYYEEKLEEEYLRARRTKNSLGLIKLGIDDFFEIEQKMGEAYRDQLIFKISKLVVESGRDIDTICRTQLNEISIIMPLSSKKGAAIRAERIRRLVENADWNHLDFRMTISLGISEYPSLSENSHTLNQTALKALQFVNEKGGNKICVFKPHSQFRPDFIVEGEA